MRKIYLDFVDENEIILDSLDILIEENKVALESVFAQSEEEYGLTLVNNGYYYEIRKRKEKV